MSASQYRDFLRTAGELEFEIWDRDSLAERICGLPDVGFPSFAEGALVRLLSEVDDGSVSQLSIERYSRTWILPAGGGRGLWRAAFETAIVAHRLAVSKRLDLACYSALALSRGVWASLGDTETSNEVEPVARVAREMFRYYAGQVVAATRQMSVHSVMDFVKEQGGSVRVAYPVRCSKLLEILGMVALDEEADEGQRRDAARIINQIIRIQPGASHPASDNWAVSLIPAALVMKKINQVELNRWLLKVSFWVCESYDTQVGLAAPRATPETEAKHLLYQVFPQPSIRRNQTYLGAVLLDLMSLFRMSATFRDLLNDLAAVTAIPTLVEAGDDPSQYLVDGPTLAREANARFDAITVTGSHHDRAPNSYRLNRLGRHWEHLAISLVLRDRHFLPTIRALMQIGIPTP